MSNFLNFCTTFLFFVAYLIGGHRDHLPIMYSSVTSCHLTWWSQRNGIQWKLRASSYGLCMLHKTGWTHIEHLLNTCECMWTSMSEYWTAHEHLLSVHECQWVSGNSPWTPIECAWMPMSEYWTSIECAWMPLSHSWTRLTMVWPWERSHLCQNWTLNTPWTLVSARERLWVIIEHTLNACECTWVPMSEYWTPPEHPMSAHECQRVSGNSPWTPIECAWMTLSKYLEGLNALL